MSGAKAILVASFAALGVYLGQMLVPFLVLVAVMLLDYITGMSKAWTKGELSSKIGFNGILKKLGYFVIVAVAMVADYIIRDAMVQAGIPFELKFFVGLICIVWLIINECISILENLAEIGVPVPGWMLTLIKKLKIKAEETIPDDEIAEVE